MGNLLVIVIAIYVVSQIYFNVDSKIVSKKRYDESIRMRNEDLARQEKSDLLEQDLKVLTVRMGELTTDLRNYQIAYNDLKVKYDAKEAEVNEWMKQSEDYKQQLDKLTSKDSKSDEEKKEVKEKKKSSKKTEN